MTLRRTSPYPSPNASPRGAKYTKLEYDSGLNLGGGGRAMGLDMGLGMGNLGNTSVTAGFGEEVRGTYSGPDVAGASVDGSQKADSVISNNGGEHNNLLLPSHILKVNVTTGRTASASHRRRQPEANFACTVPGSGSTFTRGFNFQGHLRSHFEEKPYKSH